MKRSNDNPWKAVKVFVKMIRLMVAPFFCKSTSPRASFCQQPLIFCMVLKPLKEEFSTCMLWWTWSRACYLQLLVLWLGCRVIFVGWMQGLFLYFLLIELLYIILINEIFLSIKIFLLEFSTNGVSIYFFFFEKINPRQYLYPCVRYYRTGIKILIVGNFCGVIWQFVCF